MNDAMRNDDYLAGLRLDGRGIVVLGAGGGGIGTETARALSQAGADLLLVDIDESRAADVARLTGGKAFAADLLNESEVRRVFEEAEREFGAALYGLVDVVGMVKPGGMLDVDGEAIEAQIDIILKHAIWAVRAAGPLLAHRGAGAMAFVGSLAGAYTAGRNPYYGVAKAGLHQLVRFAAREFGPSGVRTNAVAPSLTTTPRIVQAMGDSALQAIAEANPLRRIAEPADIARSILFLMSDLASYVNGNILMLDGGISFGGGY